MNDTTAVVTTSKKPIIEQHVTMTDGRVVTFTGKRQLLKEAFLTEAGNVAVRFDLVNGETFTCTTPESLVKKAAGHGIGQKVGDECAGLDDVADMALAIRKRIVLIEAGDWNTPREASIAGTGLLQLAIMRLGGKTAEDAKAAIDKLSAEQRKALPFNPRVAPIIAEIKAERAAKSKKATVETDGALDSILG